MAAEETKWSVGQNILDNLLINLKEFIEQYYGLFVNSFEHIFAILVTLYVMGIGYATMMGMLGERTKAAWISVFFVFFSYVVAFNPGFFFSWVVDPLLESSLGLASFILNPKSSSGIFGIYTEVDKVFSIIFHITDKYSNESGFTFGMASVKIFFVTFGLAFLFGVLYAVFTGLLLVGIFSFHMMMVLGGIIILLAGFPFTRHVFWAWLRACFNYALIPVFTAIVMAITLMILKDAAAQMNTLDVSHGVFNKEIGSVFLIGVLSVWFHLKAPEFSAVLTGSTATGSGFFGTLGALAQGGSAAAQAVPKGVVGVAGAPMQIAAGGLNVATAGMRAYSAMKGLFNKK